MFDHVVQAFLCYPKHDGFLLGAQQLGLDDAAKAHPNTGTLGNQKSHIWVMAAINSLRSVGFTKKSEWIEPGVIDQEFAGLTPRKRSLARPAKVWDQSNFGKKHRGPRPRSFIQLALNSASTVLRAMPAINPAR